MGEITTLSEGEFPPLPDGRTARVVAVEDIMLDGRWERGETGPKLAAFWGLSLPAVEAYAAEASRNIQRNMDGSAIKANVSTKLTRGLDRAMREGDLNALARLGKVLLDMSGQGSPKVQINVLQSAPVQEFAVAVAELLGALCPSTHLTDVDCLSVVKRGALGRRGAGQFGGLHVEVERIEAPDRPRPPAFHAVCVSPAQGRRPVPHARGCSLWVAGVPRLPV